MTIEEKDEIDDRSLFIPGGRVGVLLIHGLGGTPVELRFIAQGLARAGYTVYCCQLAGHCGTPEELRRSTWHEWYASVEAAHDMLKEHCDVILAGGLSMGGILALHLAQNRPESVQGLLLLRADPEARRLVDALALGVPAVRAAAAGAGSRSNLPSASPTASRTSACGAWWCRACRAAIPALPAYSARRCAHLRTSTALVAAVKPDLGKVRQPALIVHPRDDDMASLKNAQYLQANLGGLVDTLILDDSYHIVTLDQQRHIVAERTERFVNWVDTQVAAKAERATRVAKGVAVE